MNPMGLMELGQIKEQEHMREALRRSALREARKQAGVTWIQLVRARLFRQRDGVAAAAPAARPTVETAPAPSAAPVAPTSVAATTNATPVLVHEIRIRQRPTLVSGGAARASAPASRLRVVEAAPPDYVRVVEADEPDCVGVDC